MHRGASSEEPINFVTIIVLVIVFLVGGSSSFATTQGLNQIATPDLQPDRTLALSFDLQDRKIGNPISSASGDGTNQMVRDAHGGLARDGTPVSAKIPVDAIPIAMTLRVSLSRLAFPHYFCGSISIR